MDARGSVEAALFSSSHGLRVIDIVNMTGLTEARVREVLKQLYDEYERRNSAIEIVKINSEYKMKVRDEYSHYTERFTQSEISRGAMKTLVTIAYNQPILQSELSKKIGSRVYEDVPTLIALDLISGKKAGQTIELKTTKHFMDYFGIEGNKKEDIVKWIDSMSQ